MIKKVVYRIKGEDEVKEELFKIKGTRKSNGLLIDRESETESLKFIKQPHIDYLGSYYGED